MNKAPTKLDQLRAFREAAAARLEGAKALRKSAAITAELREAVTKVMGRPRKHKTDAEKQRAYRQRRKA